MNEIFGYIERITFQNSENGYTVAKLQEPRKQDLTTIVGSLPSIQPGESIRLFGEWKNHLVHGAQFEVKNHRVEAPADVLGIKKYLGSGLIKGIGPVYAGKIVDRFGTETLTIIDQYPEKLLEIQGLGKKKLEKISKCWSEQKSIREVMIFLQKYEVSPAYAQKIFKTYGTQSIKKVQENPFTLARDIFGIGFKTADTIAKKMGIEKDAPQRIDSGIEYVLSELSSDGHVCYPVDDFLTESETMLEVDRIKIEERIDFLKQDNRIALSEFVHEGALRNFIWIKPLYISEIGTAKEINRLQKASSNLRSIDLEKALDWVQEKLTLNLAPNQKIAVSKALSEKIQIITGGPGTGKSTITNAILTISEKLTSKIVLAAPTGRAAKRMSEITGKKASTIHSLLEFDFRKGGFKRNRETPLDCDLIIVDEASMIDTLLIYSLLKAIPSHARVIFVGDINQLPSVGPGNVLKDLIASNCVTVTMLTEIFRQAQDSQIITNAHKINQGMFPSIQNLANSDFFFLEAEDYETVNQTIISLITQRLPKKYRLDPVNDIQVLAPMRRGAIGIEQLNNHLQEILNPNKEPLFRSGRKLKQGDKVMQIRNNYQKEVFNGDIGRIDTIDFQEQQLSIAFDEKIISYEFSELDEIVLAYAVSVHKSQGSEYPCIVMPVHTSHFKLLNRNLLYTGVTRGKRLVVLVGTKKALAIAVKNNEVKNRYTGLKQALLCENSTHKKLPF